MPDMSAMFWVWLSMAVIFLILELISPTLLFICFVVGSAAAAIFANLQPDSYYWQVGIFLAISLVLLPLTRRFAKKITTDQPEHANIDRMIGKRAVVTKAISPSQPGQVRFEGEVWSASSNASIEESADVRITGISGTRVTVEPAGGTNG